VSTKIGGHQVVEEDAQKLRVRLVERNGRRRYDPASKDRLVAACLEPGVSVSRLAFEHGINANLLWKWIKKAKGGTYGSG
jgi:transposase